MLYADFDYSGCYNICHSKKKKWTTSRASQLLKKIHSVNQMSDSSGVCDQIIIYFLLLSVPNSHQQFFVQSNYVCSLTSAHAFQIPIPYVYFC